MVPDGSVIRSGWCRICSKKMRKCILIWPPLIVCFISGLWQWRQFRCEKWEHTQIAYVGCILFLNHENKWGNTYFRLYITQSMKNWRSQVFIRPVLFMSWGIRRQHGHPLQIQQAHFQTQACALDINGKAWTLTVGLESPKFWEVKWGNSELLNVDRPPTQWCSNWVFWVSNQWSGLIRSPHI